MMSFKSLKLFLWVGILMCMILSSGCSLLDNVSAKPENPIDTLLLDKVQRYMDVSQLGYSVIGSQEYTAFLEKIPSKYKSNRLFLARVDQFAIGQAYGDIDQWDLALENGMIKGLLSSGYKVSEKLDFVARRNSSEIVGTSPNDAFYMHGIDLDDHLVITDDYNAPLLLEYQVIEFSETLNSVVMYFRMVELNSMKILASTIVKSGERVEQLSRIPTSEYDRAYTAIAGYDFPELMFRSLSSTAVLDIDILNITGIYKTEPSKLMMAVENGLISGLIDNNQYNPENAFLVEKSKGFKLKYPAVYNSIVFNTSPILYEEWSEFIEATGCSELIMYRYIKDEGLFVKVVDARQNGRVLFSDVIPFNDSQDKGVFLNHKTVADKFAASFDYNLVNSKKLMLIDGDKQSIPENNYTENRMKYNEMHLAIEEGIISALVNGSIDNDYEVYEKLKTLYLKRSWMYEDKVFNLNPLYLDDWNQLREFGVDVLILYNNLIPYENLQSTFPAYKKVAVGYRVIDLKSGDVISVGELTNLEGDEK